jgi:hypothetical protein
MRERMVVVGGRGERAIVRPGVIPLFLMDGARVETRLPVEFVPVSEVVIPVTISIAPANENEPILHEPAP